MRLVTTASIAVVPTIVFLVPTIVFLVPTIGGISSWKYALAVMSLILFRLAERAPSRTQNRTDARSEG